MDRFKAFAIHFLCFFIYIIDSIWSIRKSLKQHVFTNSEAATGDVLKKIYILRNFALGVQLYLKIVSDTGVFLRVLRNF